VDQSPRTDAFLLRIRDCSKAKIQVFGEIIFAPRYFGSFHSVLGCSWIIDKGAKVYETPSAPNLPFNNMKQVRFLLSGVNWPKIGSIVCTNLYGRNSPLGDDHKVTMTVCAPSSPIARERGTLVSAGEYDFSMDTPGWQINQMYAGIEPYRKLSNLRHVTTFYHDDRLVLAVSKDLGIKSIGDIANKKIPLRVSTVPPSPTYRAIERVLACYGFTFKDIERWGGKVLLGDMGHTGRRVEEFQNGTINAVFDEAIGTREWHNLAEKFDLEFLPVENSNLDILEQKYGMKRGVITASRLRGVEKDIPTIDFTGWCLFTREEADPEIVELVLQKIEEKAEDIAAVMELQSKNPTRWIPERKFTVDMREMCKDAPIPLHPGAESYYRKKGYL
jgi:uncharacterized protein